MRSLHAYYREASRSLAPLSDNSVTARLREPGAVEYLHRWEQLVGGICRSGFVIEDLVEPGACQSRTSRREVSPRAQTLSRPMCESKPGVAIHGKSARPTLSLLR